MRFKFLSLCFSAALLSGTAYGAIRVYNPETGKSELANTLEGAAKPTAPSITTSPQAPARQPYQPRRAPVQPILLESEIEDDIDDRLGTAYFFLESSEYSPTFMTKLKEVQNIKGLNTKVYIPAKDPKQYLREIAASKHLSGISAAQIKAIEKLDIDMSVDSDNAAFTEHRPGGWQTVVYYDADNSRRVYKLPYGLENLRRHVKRARDAQQGRR